MAVNWETLLSVDATTIGSLFVSHRSKNAPKIDVRGFSIPFTGTQQRCEKLIQCLRRQLIKYVFPESQRPEDIDWAIARDKFGDNDPSSDGKLGEMLLYLFVEAYLNAPLMGFKLKDLGNPNDQVKGADGVFVGAYAGSPAILIGESKIHQTIASAVHSTLDSLQRFHDGSGPYTNELMIARKYPAERGLSPETLKVVDDLLTGAVDRILVHPVFISYDCKEIANISQSSATAPDAEKALEEYILSVSDTWMTTIDSHRSTFVKPFQVYLDFFFLPCEDSLALRNAFYEMLHGHPYESGAVKAAVKRTQKDFKDKAKLPKVSVAVKSSRGKKT